MAKGNGDKNVYLGWMLKEKDGERGHGDRWRDMV